MVNCRNTDSRGQSLQHSRFVRAARFIKKFSQRKEIVKTGISKPGCFFDLAANYRLVVQDIQCERFGEVAVKTVVKVIGHVSAKRKFVDLAGQTPVRMTPR